MLVAYNWPRNSDRYRRIEKFVEHFFPRLAEFQKPPRHPKWADAWPGGMPLMSSPINDKSFEDRLKYAPPWARRPSPKDNVEARPAEAPKETLPEPERVAPPRNLDPPAAGRLAIAPGPTTAPGAPDQPSTWLRAPARGFEGDRAMRELRTRMTLDPQLVPEPPQPASRGPALKRVVRLLAITGFAAGAAYLVVLFAFPDAKQTALDERDT